VSIHRPRGAWRAVALTLGLALIVSCSSDDNVGGFTQSCLNFTPVKQPTAGEVVPVAVIAPLAGGRAWVPVACGIAAVLGHVFSPYVRFKGGKGVATAAGMFLALAPLAVLCAFPIWALVVWLSGYVSLGSVVTAALFPVWVRLTRPDAPYAFYAAVALALLIVVSHRANLRRLVAGTENRFGRRAGAGSG